MTARTLGLVAGVFCFGGRGERRRRLGHPPVDGVDDLDGAAGPVLSGGAGRLREEHGA